MAIRISIANQKGGCGKTSTAINLADALRRMGYKVLFLDCDAQANATKLLQMQPEANPGVSTHELKRADLATIAWCD